MSILSFNIQSTGLVGDLINPRYGSIVTTNDLSTITAVGYLNGQNASGNFILPTDIFYVIYNFDEENKSGDFGIFNVIYNSKTGFTLSLQQDAVIFPISDGDVVVFNGTSGQIKDGGKSLSNVILNSATSTMESGECLYLGKGTVTIPTLSSGTLDTQAGVITVTDYTVPAGGGLAVTLNNDKILSDSVFLITFVDSGDIEAFVNIYTVLSTGQAIMEIINTNDFSIDNATLSIHFAIF